MSSTVRKQAPRPARPVARYWKGKAPKGVADVGSDSEEEEEINVGAEDGDEAIRDIEGGDEDEDEDEGDDILVKKTAKAQSVKMNIALRDVDISREGKVIVAGREESGKTTIEQDVEDEEDEEEEEEEEEVEEESSEEESDEEEEPQKPMFRPVFVPKRGRVTVLEREKDSEFSEEALEKKRLEEEERKKTSHEMVAESIRRELAEKEKEAETPDIDDTDGLDPEGEFEAWRLRELSRIKRDKEEQLQRDLEREEVERRRALPEEQRMKEDLEHAKKTREEKPKGKQKFLQKYWHKGAFRQDDEIMKKHDYTEATESAIDVTLLPKVMQVRDFGKRSRTKYTHLLDQDTTIGVGGFGGSEFLKKPGAALPPSGSKPPQFTNGCFLCGGAHLKKDCPQNEGGPSATGANANGTSGTRRWGQGRDDHDESRRERRDYDKHETYNKDRPRSPRRDGGRYGDRDRRESDYRGHRRDDGDRYSKRRDYGERDDSRRASRYSRSLSRSPPRRDYRDGEGYNKNGRRHSRDHSLDNDRRDGKRIRTD